MTEYKFEFTVENISRDVLDSIFNAVKDAIEIEGGTIGGGYEIVKDSDGKKEDRAV